MLLERKEMAVVLYENKDHRIGFNKEVGTYFITTHDLNASVMVSNIDYNLLLKALINMSDRGYFPKLTEEYIETIRNEDNK